MLSTRLRLLLCEVTALSCTFTRPSCFLLHVWRLVRPLLLLLLLRPRLVHLHGVIRRCWWLLLLLFLLLLHT